jgi:hypothetical protein
MQVYFEITHDTTPTGYDKSLTACERMVLILIIQIPHLELT